MIINVKLISPFPTVECGNFCQPLEPQETLHGYRAELIPVNASNDWIYISCSKKKLKVKVSVLQEIQAKDFGADLTAPQICRYILNIADLTYKI